MEKVDEKILKRLAKTKSSKGTVLAKSMNVPRTSLLYRLEKMRKRRLLKKIRVRNHQEWAITETGKKKLICNKMSREIAMKDDLKSMRAMHQEIIELSRYKKINSISVSNPKGIVSFLKEENIKSIHEEMGDYSTAMDGICTTKTIETFLQIPTEILESTLNYSSNWHVVDEKLLEGLDNISVIHPYVNILSKDLNKLIKIRNPELAANLRQLIQNIKEVSGQKINLNQMTKSQIYSRKK